MPRPRSPMPPLPLTFSVRDALAAGVSRGALRHPRFAKPFRGVRTTISETVPASTPGEQVLRAATTFLPRLRAGEAVSHASALLLYGCPIRVAPDLHVTCPPGYAPTRTRGVIGHQEGSPTARTRVRGVPVLTPATAVVQSAGSLPLRELVVAIDHLIRPHGNGRGAPSVDQEVLLQSAKTFRGRGACKLRLALSLALPGAESRMETLTRLLLVAYGLEGSFTLQSAVRDDDGWIGRFDLVDHACQLIVEFDGDQHRTSKTQYEKDLWRLDRARAAGYRVIRLLSGDVLHRPDRAAARIAAALGQSLRPHPLRDSLLGFAP